MPVPPLLDPALSTRNVRVKAGDVVYVKSIFEASEGLAALFAEHGGDLVIAAHTSRVAELDEVLADLANEIQMIVTRET